MNNRFFILLSCSVLLTILIIISGCTSNSYVNETSTTENKNSYVSEYTKETTYNYTTESYTKYTTRYFSNAYGTADTICAHSGCTNYIASTGDTNCCTVHSNKCLECGKYIDEDALYCISCLTSAANNLKYGY